ncbi:MAG TPA: lactate utilization protein [Candidatus Paceibacterota bacterium]|nr:lactate utilization protein [Candidatus Paceibacterota bacterium]
MEYNAIAPRAVLEKTVEALKSMNVEGIIVKDRSEALAKIKELIPAGASVMNGASKTLEEIGFVGHLKSGDHDWHNLHEAILSEKDPVEQAKLRKMSVVSDFYLGSVHAIAQTGEMVIVSNTGSQLPHIVYTSPNLIFVVGANKVMPTLEDARKRVVEHVVPLEDVRLMGVYNAHTHLSKELIFHWENPMMGRKVRVLLVEEALGF